MRILLTDRGGRRFSNVAIAAASLVAAGTASAQFFPPQLPSDDFVWTWGRSLPEAEKRGFSDLDVRGSESSFQCHLTAKLSIASSRTASDLRQLENELRSSLFFIQTVANTMYYLEQSFDLDWAVLDCDKYEDDPDEATSAEREDKARERAERARERRRAREQE
jgi:hypothetical protein